MFCLSYPSRHVSPSQSHQQLVSEKAPVPPFHPFFPYPSHPPPQNIPSRCNGAPPEPPPPNLTGLCLQLVCIDGHSVRGWDGDKAAVFLRGRSGSSVNIRLARRTLQLPGVAGRPESIAYTEYKQVATFPVEGGGQGLDYAPT